jgi:hypothetical protein
MPFQNAAALPTNEGQRRAEAVYWNIDLRAYKSALPADTLYFHAQYRQATPNHAMPANKINLEGKENYVWMEATGRGHFAGVTMSVVETQDGWWGEGDDMIFVMARSYHPSMEPVRRIIFWAHGILAENRLLMGYSEHQSLARSCRAGDGPSIAFTWIHQSRLRSLCARQSSMDTQTIAEITFIQLLTGIRQNLTPLSRLCPLQRCECRTWFQFPAHKNDWSRHERRRAAVKGGE